MIVLNYLTAEAYVMSLLAHVGKEVEYSFDMWTTPQEDEEL